MTIAMQLSSWALAEYIWREVPAWCGHGRRTNSKGELTAVRADTDVLLGPG